MATDTAPSTAALRYIPAAYGLAIVPHGYYLVRMMLATRGGWSNISPRQNWEALRAKVPSDVYNRCLRARGAHLNALEGFPLFAAAMLASTIAPGRAADADRAGLMYLGVRAAYTALYVGVKGEAMSYLRTGVWGWSVAVPVWLLWRCAGGRAEED